MTKPVFSLHRLAGCKKTMRTAAVMALLSLTTPVYSGGLTNLVKGITDRTILYAFTEQNDASFSPTMQTKRGVAAIVYSPSKHNRGMDSQSAFRVAQVSNALGGQYTVMDLTPARDYTLNAAKKEEKKYLGMTSGAWIGTTIILLGVGLTAWLTNDDGNRNIKKASGGPPGFSN